jgi:glycosyltransferase involved in cell wall biosynthesis
MPTSMDERGLGTRAPGEVVSCGQERTASPTVLHLIGSLDRGGTESQLVQFIERSAEPQHHVVMAWAGAGDLASELSAPPVWARAHPDAPRRAFDVIAIGRSLRRTIRERGVDLVHAHLSAAEFMAAFTTPPGIPIVASRRGRTQNHADRTWFRAAERLSHRRLAAMVCNSEELATFTFRHDAAPPPVSVIPNGVDLVRFRPSALPPEPVVAVVANLIAYKRHDRFLRAFAGVARAVPDARAVLVGDGPERPALEWLVAELGLRDRVRFVGAVQDVRPHLASARVVALASDHEGLPNALLEAMAMGRPVVATAVGGVPELVRDGDEGRLSPPDDAAFAQALTALLSSPSDAERMGSAARRRAERYDWGSVVTRTEDLYRRVVTGQRFPRGRRID